MLQLIMKQSEIFRRRFRNQNSGIDLVSLLILALGLFSIYSLCFQQWLGLIILYSSVFFLLFVYLSLDHPEILIFITLFLNITYFPYKSATFFIILLLCIVLFLKHLQNVDFKFHPDIITVLWLLMGVLVIFTLPKWNDLLNGLEGTINLVVMPLLLYQIVKEGWIKQLTISKIFRTYVPLLIIYLIVQVFITVIFSKDLPKLGSDINIMAYHSLNLKWGRSNYVTAILVYLLLAVVSAKDLFGENVFSSVFINVIIIVGLFPVILILSRGSILAFICGLVIYWFLHKNFYGGKIKVGHWIIMGFPTVIILFEYLYKLWQRFSQAKVDPSTLIRLYIWRESFLKIKNNLVIGAGPGQNLFTDFNYMGVNDPHNMFLRYGVDLGVLSMILIAIILILPLVKMYSLHKKKEKNINNIIILFTPSYIAAIIISQLEVVITSYLFGMLFWLFYALMWQNINLCQQNITTNASIK